MAKKPPQDPSSPAPTDAPADADADIAADPPVSGVSLAQQAIAPRADHDTIADRLRDLSPEQAEMFVRIIEITMKRRRVMLLGYLSALFAMIIGMGWALYMYGTHEPGTFIGWVFLVPVGLVGLIMWIFGRWSKRIE